MRLSFNLLTHLGYHALVFFHWILFLCASALERSTQQNKKARQFRQDCPAVSPKFRILPASPTDWCRTRRYLLVPPSRRHHRKTTYLKMVFDLLCFWNLYKRRRGYLIGSPWIHRSTVVILVAPRGIEPRPPDWESGGLAVILWGHPRVILNHIRKKIKWGS